MGQISKKINEYIAKLLEQTKVVQLLPDHVADIEIAGAKHVEPEKGGTIYKCFMLRVLGLKLLQLICAL